MQTAKPHLIVCFASSVDGKISTVRRDPVSFPSRNDREHLFRLRDSVDAIVTAAATIRAEDPPLLPSPERQTRRLAAGLSKLPARVVVSRTLNFPSEGRSFRPRDGSQRIAYTSSKAPGAKIQAFQEAGISVQVHDEERVDLKKAMADLHDRWGLRRILCEGGGVMAADLFAADLVDEFFLTLCPLILGGANAPTPCDGAGHSLETAPRLELVTVDRWDDELCLHYRRKK
ncbi:MAG: dihydrofolate reductase family protein [Planctomycetota bacterium]|nr:dihydrofolate reductase family protein [Planctomycetota bacterium]